MKNQMHLKALYRADGSKKIGMGHLFRAFFIHEQLWNRFKTETIVIVKEDAAARRFIEQRKLKHIIIPASATVNEEINLLEKITIREKLRLFFLDVLENDINPSYIKALNNQDVALIAITDDSFFRPINADLILNGNPNQINYDYSKEPGKYLIGPKYFIMSSDYSSIEVSKPRNKPHKILVTLGGSDHNNLIFKVLDAIGSKYKITIVTSKNTGYFDRLKDYLGNNKSLNYTLFVDVNNLANHWKENDIAITAGGNTLFERIATRLPGATVCQIQRQMEIADKFEELGVNVNIGFGPRLTNRELKKKMLKFIENLENHIIQFNKSPEIINGNGVELLMDEIGKLLNQDLRK